MSDAPQSNAAPTLPAIFVERLAAIVPPELLPRVLASFGREKPLCARYNPLRGTREAAVEGLRATGAELEALPQIPDAWIVRHADRRAVTDAKVVTSGLVHLTNPSSMLPPLALGVAPDDHVLDLCAAPGGKTLHLAGLLSERGHLAAVEAVKPRFFKLKGVLDRGGATAPGRSLRLFLKDGRSVGGAVPERFDKVLVDAPCSSEARFDALDPTSFAHWSPKKVAECAHKQRGLLRSGLEALRPGGALVYCTCSFAPEENEHVVLEVLRSFPGTVRATSALPYLPAEPPLHTPGIGELTEAIRVLPDDVWDGFFLVRLEKTGP